MHPASSLIAFTTLSGFGLGLLAFLGLGHPAPSGWVAFVFFALGYGLTLAGLGASTLHLGHPERALKAFTQWRSSWLSREAWLAGFALTAMAPYAAGLVFWDHRLTLLGWIGAVLCLATVAATAMIYTQLKTVPRWNHWSTPAMFLLYAVTGGALLAGQVALAAPMMLALGVAQLTAWQAGDKRFRDRDTDMASATGLGGIGQVRAFEPPHTGTNYLLTEMVHVVARRHSAKLRMISVALMAFLPWGLLLLPFSHALAGIAVIAHVAGVLVARWLFYAEAEHVVGLYYGKR